LHQITRNHALWEFGCKQWLRESYSRRAGTSPSATCRLLEASNACFQTRQFHGMYKQKVFRKYSRHAPAYYLLASEPHSRAHMASTTKPDPSKYSKTSRVCKLKAIARKSLLKQYASTTVTDYPYTPPSQFATPVRPTMGIKDSDDYITARAANPRTGLISPSPAATPRTPESPAEALKLRSQRTRPALTRANEARKISAGGLQKWCADEHGWSREDAKSGVASPRPSETNVGAADIICDETEAL
jgi:hypothetical protein